MRKFYIAALMLLSFCSERICAQNINLQVRITKLEKTGYSDCSVCGDPDPTWKIQGTNNGSGATITGPVCSHYAEMNFNLWDINDYLIQNITNSNATTFTLGFSDAFEKSCSNNNCTYESYNFFTCSPSVYGDARRCQNPNLVTVNFQQQPPCQWNAGVSPFCGDFKFHYEWQWSYNYAPTIAVQPAASTAACLGSAVQLSVTAGLDGNGFNMGRNFQWQVSASTACPGTGWTDVTGATNASFTVPQTGGTRLYRCKVTSNCTPNFATNTTISNCAVVTYNPIGSPGDPVPDIVSGICNSTVLPGSTHILDVVQAPDAGAALGLSGYAWTSSGGAPATGSGPTFAWTAPITPGAYNINLTYLDNCPQPDAVANTCVVNVGSPTCDFAYVSTAGVDALYAGGPDVPYRTIAYALSQMNGRKKMRVASGVYQEFVPLVLQDSFVIDGGYKVSGNIWTKTNIDSTIVVGNGTSVINTDVAHRVAFVANNADNWVLQDLIIRTTDVSLITTSGKGYSNYAVLAINGSSGFRIIRSKLLPGDGAKGLNGTTPAGAGSAGGGGNGGNGGNGNGPSCGGCGVNGNGGSSGNGGAAAGAGGGNCCGSGCNIFGCNGSSCTAGNGTIGSPGAAGSGFAAGVRPATPGAVNPYYIPDAQAATGNNGFGGGGGGGGGGGDMGTDCSCSQSGNANGGRGGNGGGGGLPGSGGFGGGGSFGLYAAGAGTTGAIITSQLLAGGAGAGGDGAAGQPGAGGIGGNGGNVTGGDCSPRGIGGNGGTGGTGGAGGRGQDGANGLAQAVLAVGGASITGSSTSVPNLPTYSIDYFNGKACINSEIQLNKASGVWSFSGGVNIVQDLRDQPAGFPISSYFNSSTPVAVYVTTPNTDYNLTIDGTVYNAVLKVASDQRQLPVITPSSHSICIDGAVSLTASGWGTQTEYDWRIYQGTSLSSPVYQSTLPSPSANLYGVPAGLYTIRYRVREQCCGWSKPVFDTLRILPLPIQFVVTGGGSYCPGSNGLPVYLSSSEVGLKYVLLFNGVPVDSLTGTGTTLTFPNQTAVGNYTVQAERITGCGQAMLGNVSIQLYPLPQIFDVQGGGSVCASGSTSTRQITLNGSELGVNYQLYLNGITPVGLPVVGSGNSLTFGFFSAPGYYIVRGTFAQSGCTELMNDSAIITLIANPNNFNLTGVGSFCAGDSGRLIGLAGSDAGLNYQLNYQGAPIGTAVTGTGTAISFGNFANVGNYTVLVTDTNGCQSTLLDTIAVAQLQNPQITNVTVTQPGCAGANNGVISISGASPNGGLNYSIDSALTFGPASSFSNLTPGNYYVYVKDDSSCRAVYGGNAVVIANPTPFKLSLESITNVNCNGDSTGKIDITYNGGSAPYSFTWSIPSVTEDISTLPAGTYSVTISDSKGCRDSATYTVVEPAQPLAISASGFNINCPGGSDGSITTTVTGGTPAYNYSWSTISNASSISNLAAGSYAITITDARNCTASTIIVLQEPAPFVVDDSIADAKCFGESSGGVYLNVSGGNPGTLNYAWSNGTNNADLTGVPAGTYTFVVTDSRNCKDTFVFTVKQPNAILTSVAGNDPDCFENSTGFAVVSAGGGAAPYSYSWNTTPAQSGIMAIKLLGDVTYTVTVTDVNGCTKVDSVRLVKPVKVTVTTDPVDVSCFSGDDGKVTIHATGGTGVFEYYLNGLYQLDSVYSGLTGGSYQVVVEDNNNCAGTTTFSITQPDAFTLSAGNDVVSLRQQPVTLTATAFSTNGITAYKWTPSNSLDCDTCITVVATPDSTTDYVVRVTDGDGCINFDTVRVIVKLGYTYFIPSAFSPNGDGMNDFFAFDVLGAKNIHTRVFDRWGTMLYENTSQTNGTATTNAWDGTYKGLKLSYETYVYQIKVTFYDGSDDMLNGTVTIMR
jgi:gliding motility-associated-like protein